MRGWVAKRCVRFTLCLTSSRSGQGHGLASTCADLRKGRTSWGRDPPHVLLTVSGDSNHESFSLRRARRFNRASPRPGRFACHGPERFQLKRDAEQRCHEELGHHQACQAQEASQGRVLVHRTCIQLDGQVILRNTSFLLQNPLAVRRGGFSCTLLAHGALRHDLMPLSHPQGKDLSCVLRSLNGSASITPSFRRRCPVRRRRNLSPRSAMPVALAHWAPVTSALRPSSSRLRVLVR